MPEPTPADNAATKGTPQQWGLDVRFNWPAGAEYHHYIVPPSGVPLCLSTLAPLQDDELLDMLIKLGNLVLPAGKAEKQVISG